MKSRALNTNSQLAKQRGLETSLCEEIRLIHSKGARGGDESAGALLWLHSAKIILDDATQMPAKLFQTTESEGDDPVSPSNSLVTDDLSGSISKSLINLKQQRKMLAQSAGQSSCPNTYFHKILLDLLDIRQLTEGMVPSVLTGEEKLLAFLEFVVNGILRKQPYETIPPGMTGATLLEWVKTRLVSEYQPKRTDQKLRWVYNKVLKMLVEFMGDKSNYKQSYMEKFDLYLNAVVKNSTDRVRLRQDILTCKISSIKRFREFFNVHSYLKKDFARALDRPGFLSELLEKRNTKIGEIVQAFEDWWILSVKLNLTANTTSCEVTHRFPWSKSEIDDSIKLVRSILDAQPLECDQAPIKQDAYMPTGSLKGSLGQIALTQSLVASSLRHTGGKQDKTIP